MPEPWQQQPSLAPQLAVATRIQDLVATRLGRGFVPLGLLFGAGVVQLFMAGLTSAEALTLTLGAAAAASAMLAYGQRIVRQTFRRPHRVWMSVAVWGSLVPPAFAVYVLGWRGLRLLAAGSLPGFGAGLAFAALGTWCMRSWMKVVEIDRLARIMSVGLDEDSSTA